MNQDDKLDAILKKITETEKRISELENKAGHDEKKLKKDIAGLSAEEVVLKGAEGSVESFFSKRNKLLKIQNKWLLLIALAVAGIGVAVYIFSTGGGTPSGGPTLFEGPIGQEFSAAFVNGFSNLSSQLASVGTEQLAGNITTYPAKSGQPAFNVNIFSGNYALVPYKVPTNYSVSKLVQNGKPTFVYIGGQGCPFCASERWVFTVALSRFGNFTALFYDKSAVNDGNIPTVTFNFSSSEYEYAISQPNIETSQGSEPWADADSNAFFTGAYYTSPYINFESFDQVASSFFTQPGQQTMARNYSYYNNNVVAPAERGFGISGFSFGGVPFFDINNQYVFDGANVNVYPIFNTNNYQTHQEIMNSIQNPAPGSFGETVLAAANILTAQICAVINDTAPVCSLSYVRALQREVA